MKIESNIKHRETKTAIIQLRLEPELSNRLADYCKKENRTLSNGVRNILINFLGGK